MTYEQYIAQMTRNRERLEETERQTTISDADLAFFRSLPQPLETLVLAEDWCGDVIANLPVLGKLAKETGKFNLHIFLRDQNDDLMQQFLNQGIYKSIPVFAFFDPSLRQIGVFIERPAAFTELRNRRQQELYAANPELGDPQAPIDTLSEEQRQKRQAARAKMETELSPERVQLVVSELRSILAGVAA
jgi:hypothetical protein